MAPNLINPVEFFQTEFPEAFELLPKGADSLKPEIDLMIDRAKQRGLPIATSQKGCIFVPRIICEEVYGPPLMRH